MTEINLWTEKLLDGEAFTVAYDPVLADGGQATVHIENPSGSRKTLVIQHIDARSESSASGVFYRNPDVSGGSSSGASNDLVGNSKSTVANITHDATLSGEDSSINFTISPDTQGGFGSGIVGRPQMALSPGNSIGIQVDSASADNQILFLVVLWQTERDAP